MNRLYLALVILMLAGCGSLRVSKSVSGLESGRVEHCICVHVKRQLDYEHVVEAESEPSLRKQEEELDGNDDF